MKTLPLVLALALGGCALKDGDEERTNADFKAPTSVKKNGMVEVVAMFAKGSNGNPLEYKWALSGIPQGSDAAFNGQTGQTATFEADALGEYFVTLVVSDGRTQSSPVTQMVKALNSAPDSVVTTPKTDVGIGELVEVDGSQSVDCDGDAITYRWYFDHLPQGSNAELSDPTAAKPTFVPDLPGLYAVAMVASDGMDEGEPNGVFIWAGDNSPPVAVAGDDVTVSVNDTVVLDGGGSYDPDGATVIITYDWRIVDRPSASNAQLTVTDEQVTELVPDVAGDYQVQLMVYDNREMASAPDSVTITAQ